MVKSGLFIAEDIKKDQSYFLFQTNKKHMECLKFPLGEFKKTETRDLAKKFNIPVARKPEKVRIYALYQMVIIETS